jgi:hypothetical protein
MDVPADRLILRIIYYRTGLVIHLRIHRSLLFRIQSPPLGDLGATTDNTDFMDSHGKSTEESGA